MAPLWQTTGPTTKFERRESPRVPVFWAARVNCDEQVQDAVCYNVSHQGMALYLWDPPEPQTMVQVAVDLPNGYQVWTAGKVVHGPRNGERTVGLLFVPHPDQVIDAVHAFVDKRVGVQRVTKTP